MIKLESIITDKNDGLERTSGLIHGLVQQGGETEQTIACSEQFVPLSLLIIYIFLSTDKNIP